MQKVITSHGNRKWSQPYEWADTPRYQVMKPPELLRLVAAELATLGMFDLSAALTECAEGWGGEAMGRAESLCCKALETPGLSESSRVRLEVVLEAIEQHDLRADDGLASKRMNWRP